MSPCQAHSVNLFSPRVWAYRQRFGIYFLGFKASTAKCRASVSRHRRQRAFGASTDRLRRSCFQRLSGSDSCAELIVVHTFAHKRSR